MKILAWLAKLAIGIVALLDVLFLCISLLVAWLKVTGRIAEARGLPFESYTWPALLAFQALGIAVLVAALLIRARLLMRETAIADLEGGPIRIGCLPVLIGAIVGFFVVLALARSQAFTLGDYALRGESRSRLVFAYSGVGAIVGALLFGVVSAVRQKTKRGKTARSGSA